MTGEEKRKLVDIETPLSAGQQSGLGASVMGALGSTSMSSLNNLHNNGNTSASQSSVSSFGPVQPRPGTYFEKYPLYFDGESVKGKVQIRPRDSGKRIEHNGIRVEFVGEINDRGHKYDFLCLQQELAVPGELRHAVAFDFEFKNVEKQYECYFGINVKLRYFVRVTISRRLADIVAERVIWVYSYRMPPEINDVIKMEVGIEDCLHIEFEYSKSKYSLRDVIVGKIYFLLVRIKIKNMELSIIRRETAGVGSSQYNESQTIVKYDIMDGAPARGETIPIRLFMGNLQLTPTLRDVNKKFSCRYYLNLVLIDEENRRYFKQQEITLYRLPARDEPQSLSAEQPKLLATAVSVDQVVSQIDATSISNASEI